jgi:Fe-S cluster assembly protein SufD
VKTRSRVTLSGEGADARLKGLYVAREGRHVDIGTLQEHRSPRATSDALYKGAVHPGGRSVFQGLIEVAPGAPKTDAYLTNNNLVLGEGARADSIPQLNILTDDVKCSHGSTTGKLDPGQIFYLQSRGFSPDGARRELTRAFLNQVLLEVPESVSMILSDDLDAALSIT